MDNEIPNYQEIERLIPSHAKEIKSILKDKYGLEIPINCDEFVKRCLRLKDGNKEKAIKLIKAYHVAILDLKNWEATLAPSLYENFYNIGTCTPMQKKDELGRRIFIVRSRKWDPQEMNFECAIVGIWLMLQYVCTEFKDVQRNGYVMIWDFSEFTMKQAWAFRHWTMLTASKWAQNGVIGRLKGFHGIFHPRIVGIFYAGIKPFISEKLKKRVTIFHTNLDSLHRHVSPELLPESLGGHLDNDDGIDTSLIKDILTQDVFFKTMLEIGYPEK